MDENLVRLETWCSSASQLFIAAGRISSEDSNALLNHIRAKVLRSLHGPHGVALVNERTSLVTLPDRILRQILLQAELRDRITLAATCKHLHERCDALAVLQPVIHVRSADCWWTDRPSRSSLERAVTVARQSLPADLESVTLTWWPELSSELARFLSANLPRIRCLNVYVPFAIFNRPHCTRALFAALAMPAPLLTELHLGVFSSGTIVVTRPRPPMDAFTDPHAVHHLSSLRRLRISGMRILLHTGIIFAGVREFSWLSSEAPALTRDTLVSLIACFPVLDTLKIRANRVSWAHASLPVRSALRHVHVTECRKIDGLADFLYATRIPLLTLSQSPHGTAGALLEPLASASESMSYGCLYCEFTARPASPAGVTVAPTMRYLEPMKPDRAARWQFVSSLLHMTCLTLLDLFWPQPQTFASGTSYASGPAIHLPALTRLRVSLATCRSYRQLDDMCLGGILLGLDDPLSPLHTPALQNLEISYYLAPGDRCRAGAGVHWRRGRGCCCSRTLIVSLCDIHRFVAACVLLPSGRRLEQINIDGVEVVDPDPFPYMALLEQLATVVSVSTVPRSNSCDLGTARYDNDYDDDRLPRALQEDTHGTGFYTYVYGI